jgi:ATPase subunit of ABC transporter with duplicated ATPase domains
MVKLGPVLMDAEFDFEFRQPQSLPNPMLTMRELICGYPNLVAGEPPVAIVRHVTRSVMAGQRIGILGANGQGKSTLVKTVARALQRWCVATVARIWRCRWNASTGCWPHPHSGSGCRRRCALRRRWPGS